MKVVDGAGANRSDNVEKSDQPIQFTTMTGIIFQMVSI